MWNKNILFFISTPIVLCAAALAGPDFTLNSNIILNIRLPRVIAGFIAGAGLSVSGAVLQGLLKNPLADPYILGTSSGAGIGVILALMLGFWHSSPLFYLLVMAGALVSTLITYNIAKTGKTSSSENLVLSGIIVSTFLGALILLFLSVARKESFSLLFFIIGSISSENAQFLSASALLAAIGGITAMLYSRHLDIMLLGEEKAASLGVDTEKLKKILFAASAVMTGSAVALAGTIGFVGLMAPHILRFFTGPGHKKLIPASILGGGVFLVTADAFARTLAAPAEIPVGIITALSGAPFFIWLLKNSKKKANGRWSILSTKTLRMGRPKLTAFTDCLGR